MALDEDTRRLLDTKAVDLIGVDFAKIYDVYLFQIKERSEAVRLFIATLSAPFMIVSALGVTKVVDINKNDLFEIMSQMPKFVYVIFIICGLIGIVPYHRFCAAHCQSYKMIRYMNNFRMLYYSCFERLFREINWKLYAETQHDAPKPDMMFHWVTVVQLIMAVINSIYIGMGMALLDGSSLYLGPIIGILVSLGVHIFLWKIESKVEDITRGKPQ